LIYSQNLLLLKKIYGITEFDNNWYEYVEYGATKPVTILLQLLQSYIGFWGLSHESETEAWHTGSTGQTELPRDTLLPKLMSGETDVSELEL